MFPWKSKNLYLVLLTSLSAVMGVSLLSPVLPSIKETFNLTDLEVGYVVTFYTFPAVMLAPAAGILVDQYGRRTILLPGLGLFGLTGMLISFAPSYTVLLLLRILQGIGGFSLALIARTLIGDLYTGTTQQSAMGLNDAILATGGALFPFLGGYLAGFGWRYPFYLYVIPILVGVAVSVFLDRVQIDTSEDPLTYITEGLNLLSDPYRLNLLLGTFLSFLLLYGAINTVAPLYLHENIGLNSVQIGSLLAYMALVMALVSFGNGPLAKYFKNVQLIFGGFSFYGIGLLGLSLTRSYLGLLISFLAFGIGHGLTLPTFNTALVSSVLRDQRGTTMAYRTVFSRLGQTTGPLLLPLIGAWLTYEKLFLILGGLLIITSVLLFFYASTFRKIQ